MKDRLSNYGPFSVYVINTLNIISILLPTAVWFKGSFVSWQSAQGAAQEKAMPVLPRADWSQEGTALCNSTEDKAESPTLVDHAFSLSLSFFSLHPTHQIIKWNFNGFLSHKHTIVLFLLGFFCHSFCRLTWWLLLFIVTTMFGSLLSHWRPPLTGLPLSRETEEAKKNTRLVRGTTTANAYLGPLMKGICQGNLEYRFLIYFGIFVNLKEGTICKIWIKISKNH